MKQTALLWLLILVMILSMASCGSTQEKTDNKDPLPPEQQKDDTSDASDPKDEPDEKETITKIYYIVNEQTHTVTIVDVENDQCKKDYENDEVELQYFEVSGDTIEIPEIVNEMSVVALGDGAFRSCKSISKYVLPHTITEFGTDIFTDCADDLTIYVVPNSYVHQYCVLMGLNFEIQPGYEEPDNENPDVTPDEEPDEEDQLDNFAQAVQEENLNLSVQIYKEHFAGDYSMEYLAAGVVEEYLKPILQDAWDGKITKNKANEKVGFVGSMVDSLEWYMDSDDMENIWYMYSYSFDSAFTSKSNYRIAVDMQKRGNWQEAISYYAAVASSDSDYETAQKELENCKTSYKNDVYAKVDAFEQSADYLNAIQELKTLLSVLGEDDEVSDKIVVYHACYIQNAISSAKAAFVTPATDYDDALKIINVALTYYPDNKELLQAKEYYSSYLPDSLYGMNVVRGKTEKKSQETDTYGDLYLNNFIAYYGPNHGTDAVFYVNSAYNIFTATVYSRSSASSANYHYLKVYGDGTVIYENLQIPDNAKAFDISVNVTGISELRIEMVAIGYYYEDSEGIGLSNMYLQKTVK